MAKIVEVVTDIVGPEFDEINVQGLSNNVVNIVQKLNTTYQQQLKDEMEAFTLFVS
jgi:hypothetical protein|tara:strand:- start:262 stop:429 length:168 start_codon:yes stop_codon:yes gene_type:complete